MRLELTVDEALVLFELLSRIDEEGAECRTEPAEQHVLWVLHGQLEKALVEPFETNYRDLVKEARLRVLQRGGSD